MLSFVSVTMSWGLFTEIDHWLRQEPYQVGSSTLMTRVYVLLSLEPLPGSVAMLMQPFVTLSRPRCWSEIFCLSQVEIWVFTNNRTFEILMDASPHIKDSWCKMSVLKLRVFLTQRSHYYRTPGHPWTLRIVLEGFQSYHFENWLFNYFWSVAF